MVIPTTAEDQNKQIDRSYYIKPRFDSIPAILKQIRFQKNLLQATMTTTNFDDAMLCEQRVSIFNEIADLWAETLIILSHQSQGYVGAKPQQLEAFYLTISWINQNLKSLRAEKRTDVLRVVDMLETYMLELLPTCIDVIVGNRSKRAGKETFTLERVMLQNSWKQPKKHWWNRSKKEDWLTQFNLPDREDY